MKVATVSTLWDYINRAMPWNAPKSLKPDEVYAVTAYLLNLGDVVPDDFTLSDTNIARGAEPLPNRNGMTTDHGMWPGRTGQWRQARRQGRGLHEELRDRADGRVVPARPRAQRARQPGRAEPPCRRAAWRRHHQRAWYRVGRAAAVASCRTPPPRRRNAAAQALARKLNCLTCHGIDNKVVGPGLREVVEEVRRTRRRRGLPGGQDRAPAAAASGAPCRCRHRPVTAADAKALAQWIADGRQAVKSRGSPPCARCRTIDPSSPDPKE